MAIATAAFTSAPVAAPAARAKRAGLFSRVVAALCASREAAARREIARHSRLISEIASRSQGQADRTELPF